MTESSSVTKMRSALACLKQTRRKKDPGRKKDLGKKKSKKRDKKMSKNVLLARKINEGKEFQNREEVKAFLKANEGLTMMIDSQEEESDDDVFAERDEENFGREDFTDNLTYREDTLSILKGEVNSAWGPAPVWITTDTGSMTQLVQTEYAQRMKFKTEKLQTHEWFHITSPGGGREDIHEFIRLKVKISVKKELIPEQRYEDNPEEEEVKVIEMKFGLCANLPVPILWGESK